MKYKKTEIQNLAFDPGYLMLAMYIFSVVVLVLIGWLGAGAAGAKNSEETMLETPIHYEIQSDNVQKQPGVGMV